MGGGRRRGRSCCCHIWPQSTSYMASPGAGAAAATSCRRGSPASTSAAAAPHLRLVAAALRPGPGARRDAGVVPGGRSRTAPRATRRPGTWRQSRPAYRRAAKNQSRSSFGQEVAGFSMSHMSETYGRLPATTLPSFASLRLSLLAMPPPRIRTISMFAGGGRPLQDRHPPRRGWRAGCRPAGAGGAPSRCSTRRSPRASPSSQSARAAAAPAPGPSAARLRPRACRMPAPALPADQQRREVGGGIVGGKRRHRRLQ